MKLEVLLLDGRAEAELAHFGHDLVRDGHFAGLGIEWRYALLRLAVAHEFEAAEQAGIAPVPDAGVDGLQFLHPPA